MKEEDLSFTNMCHLSIIIGIKLWSNIDNSRFFVVVVMSVQLWPIVTLSVLIVYKCHIRLFCIKWVTGKLAPSYYSSLLTINLWTFDPLTLIFQAKENLVALTPQAQEPQAKIPKTQTRGLKR